MIHEPVDLPGASTKCASHPAPKLADFSGDLCRQLPVRHPACLWQRRPLFDLRTPGNQGLAALSEKINIYRKSGLNTVTAGAYNSAYDLNGDGQVNVLDLLDAKKQ
jgi:hypothetical protein